MPSNIEIKAVVRDFEGLRRRVEALTEAPATVISQEDTFFRTPKGRLKLRLLAQHKAQLVFYDRADHDGPKRSDYQIFETNEPEELKSVLSQALGVRGVVKKVRHLYMVAQTRVHLDEVAGLGHFVELEVVLRPGQSDAEGQAIAQRLMSDLGIQKADLLEGAYMDLLEHRESRAGGPAAM